jgi:hypothetical protein
MSYFVCVKVIDLNIPFAGLLIPVRLGNHMSKFNIFVQVVLFSDTLEICKYLVPGRVASYVRCSLFLTGIAVDKRTNNSTKDLAPK